MFLKEFYFRNSGSFLHWIFHDIIHNNIIIFCGQLDDIAWFPLVVSYPAVPFGASHPAVLAGYALAFALAAHDRTFQGGVNVTQVPAVLVSGYYRQPYGYKTLRSEGRADWLLVYTVSGQGIFEVKGIRKQCREGDVIIIKPHMPHNYETASESVWEFYWCHFIPPSDWFHIYALPEPAAGFYSLNVANLSIQRRLSRVFRHLINDQLAAEPFHHELVLNQLEQILILFARESKRHTVPLDPRLVKILEKMRLHLGEPLSVEQLAREVALSSSRLSHLFKKQVGDTIKNTMTKLRMRQAALLLRYTSKPISEIAGELGYDNAFYFTRKFSQLYGMPPSGYRKKHAPQ